LSDNPTHREELVRAGLGLTVLDASHAHRRGDDIL
jgi:hypothetical protein